MDIVKMTREEWEAEGARRFGTDRMNWRFVCPLCGYVASVKDWKDAGADEGEVAFSCVGRHRQGSRSAFFEGGKGPCDYAGGGLFRLNPVHVTDDGNVHQVFAFADAN